MAMRTLSADESVDTIWEELVYTEARLRGDPRTSDLAAPVTEQLERLDGVRRGLWGVWRAEVLAQAAVDSADDDLDDSVDGLGKELLTTVGHDRKHPRFTRYFSQSPSMVIRKGLQAELEQVRGWPASLATEAEAPLQQRGHDLEGRITQGDAAIAQRLQAANARADYRVRQLYTFIDDVNAVRRSLYGELTKRAVEKKLAKDWPERFFKRWARKAPAPVDPQG